MPCMHGGGLIASSSSTAGWVSDLSQSTHWITATSAQCLSLFKPTRVDQPVDIGDVPGEDRDDDSLWWRHEVMARKVMMNLERLASLFLDERNSVEARGIADTPTGQDAFDEGSRLVDVWREKVESVDGVEDRRPWFARRYWSSREPVSVVD